MTIWTPRTRSAKRRNRSSSSVPDTNSEKTARPSWVRVVPGCPMARMGRSVWCRPFTAVKTWMKASWLSSCAASRAVKRAPDRTLILLAVARAFAESSSTILMAGASSGPKCAITPDDRMSATSCAEWSRAHLERQADAVEPAQDLVHALGELVGAWSGRSAAACGACRRGPGCTRGTTRCPAPPASGPSARSTSATDSSQSSTSASRVDRPSDLAHGVDDRLLVERVGSRPPGACRRLRRETPRAPRPASAAPTARGSAWRSRKAGGPQTGSAPTSGSVAAPPAPVPGASVELMPAGRRCMPPWARAQWRRPRVQRGRPGCGRLTRRG